MWIVCIVRMNEFGCIFFLTLKNLLMIGLNKRLSLVLINTSDGRLPVTGNHLLVTSYQWRAPCPSLVSLLSPSLVGYSVVVMGAAVGWSTCWGEGRQSCGGNARSQGLGTREGDEKARWGFTGETVKYKEEEFGCFGRGSDLVIYWLFNSGEKIGSWKGMLD
jgi:hypothetical protein